MDIGVIENESTPTEPTPSPRAEPEPAADVSKAPGATQRPAPSPKTTAAPSTPLAGPPRPVSEAAKEHGAKVLRTAALNPFAAVHLSRQTPIDVLRDAIVFNVDENLRRFMLPLVNKLEHADAALVLAVFATSFHGGYTMGQHDAEQGHNWHDELRQQQQRQRPPHRG